MNLKQHNFPALIIARTALQYDASLLLGMLEDQAGDLEEVAAQLKVLGAGV
jgi:hypothetical protein